MSEPRFESLPGLTSYSAARELQLELVERRARGEIPDTFLFLEHEPVVTRGRGLQWTAERSERHMPFSPTQLPAGVAFCETERGGDLTYHGPGQLVVYPIVKLDGSGFGPERDVEGFLRKLENSFVQALKEIGLSEPGSKRDATGVWVGKKKIASIGVAVRKWVTYHGIAINIVNDLGPFQTISPCGFSPEVMTRAGDLLPEGSSFVGKGWREEWETLLARYFQGASGGLPPGRAPGRVSGDP